MGLTSAPGRAGDQTTTQGVWLRRLAWASLAVNVLIVLTGGAVRLTDSGLGCSSWPTCTAGQWTPHPESGIHGLIEFGNRLMTFLLTAVALATWLAARRTRPRRRGVDHLAFAIGCGVITQAVIGGITVRTGLNPWVVGIHMIVSLAMVAGTVVLIDLARSQARAQAPASVRASAWATAVAAVVALYIGTLVTGAGPWAGDDTAIRNGFTPLTVTHLHTAAVYVLVGLTVVTLGLGWRHATVRRAALGLLGLELMQGAVGFIQYYNGMPALVIELHLLGAALVAAGTAWLVISTRNRSALGE